MLYICQECGAVHDGTELTTVPVYDSGDGSRGEVMFTETFCPDCGSDCITEAEKCPVCGDYYDGFQRMCDKCMENVKTLWKGLVSKLPDGADAYEVAAYITEELFDD